MSAKEGSNALVSAHTQGEYKHYEFADLDGNRVGEFELRWPEYSCDVELWHFETYPAYRQQGYGHDMLREAEKLAELDAPDGEYDAMRMWVKRDNDAALHLYKAHGYKEVEFLAASNDVQLRKEL